MKNNENTLLKDRNGNTSSKRVVVLSSATVIIILSLLMGLAYIYGVVFLDKEYNVAGIVAICGLLSGLITLLATISLGEKKDGQDVQIQ